jgi:hypothetical protein
VESCRTEYATPRANRHGLKHIGSTPLSSLPRVALASCNGLLGAAGPSRICLSTRATVLVIHSLQTFASLSYRDAPGHTHPRQPAALVSCSVAQLASKTKPRYLLPTSLTTPNILARALFELSGLTGSNAAWTDSANPTPILQQRCSRKLKPATMPFRHPRPSQRPAAPAIAAGNAKSNAMHKSLAGLARKHRSDAHTYNRQRRKDPKACEVRGCCMHCDE